MEFAVRIVFRGSLLFVVYGSMMCLLGGMTGCDGRPADGTVIDSGVTVSEEQKAKIKGFYANRARATNAANKKAGRKK